MRHCGGNAEHDTGHEGQDCGADTAPATEKPLLLAKNMDGIEGEHTVDEERTINEEQRMLRTLQAPKECCIFSDERR